MIFKSNRRVGVSPHVDNICYVYKQIFNKCIF